MVVVHPIGATDAGLEASLNIHFPKAWAKVRKTTTGKPWKGESMQKWHRVDQKVFEEMIKEGEFLSTSFVAGRWEGVTKAEWKECTSKLLRVCVLNVNWEQAVALNNQVSANFIGIVPNNTSELLDMIKTELKGQEWDVKE